MGRDVSVDVDVDVSEEVGVGVDIGVEVVEEVEVEVVGVDIDVGVGVGEDVGEGIDVDVDVGVGVEVDDNKIVVVSLDGMAFTVVVTDIEDDLTVFILVRSDLGYLAVREDRIGNGLIVVIIADVGMSDIRGPDENPEVIRFDPV